MRCAPSNPFRRFGRLVVLVAMLTVASVAIAPSDGPLPIDFTAPEVGAAGIGANDWLGTVNAYRAMSGLPPVAANPAWDAGERNHACYMLKNGIAHDEIPGNPGYTVSGDEAGNSSNVAVAGGGATPQDFVEMWLTAPYHAIGLLRPGWRQTSYGECREQTASSSRAGAGIDVIRGTDFGVRNTSPILFPGQNSTIRLTRFIAEWPNPLQACNWSPPAGLPVIAMMPSKVNAASATISSPDGDNPACVLHAGNAGHEVAVSILDGANAVVIIPRRHLADGRHTVSLQTNAGNVTWSFGVAKDSELSPVRNGGSSSGPTRPAAPATTTTVPRIELKNAEFVAEDTTYQAIPPTRMVDTRIPTGTSRIDGGQMRRVRVAPPDVQAVSANITVVDAASGGGYLTVYNCRAKPDTSTVNFPESRAVANITHVGLSNGDLCLYASTDLEAIVDVTGYYRNGSTATSYTPVSQRRILDSRQTAANRLRPNQPIKVTIPQSLMPDSATAAVVNLTVVNPNAFGHLTAFPCGTTPTTSNLNFLQGETIANSTVVPVNNREFCLSASTNTDIVIDFSGYYSGDSSLMFDAMSPARMFDSRSTQRGLNDLTGGKPVSGTIKLKVAGVRGIPSDAKVVNINVTGVSPTQETYVTAYPCDAGDPGTSNINLTPERGAAAGGAMVEVSRSGDICLKANVPTHIVIDITGIWT